MIKNQLGLEAKTTPGRTGQFDVFLDGVKVAERGGNWFTRQFGAGYPEFQEVVEAIKSRM